jgi:hypothetical protein
MRDLAELNLNEGGEPVSRPPPSAQQIAQFQSEFGITLPRAYLSLLAYSNGGHPELDTLMPDGAPADGYYPAINDFYYLTDDRDSMSGLWREQRHVRPILGNCVLVFARDGGDNQFFLNLSSTPSPVKVWSHDEHDLVTDLAPSFEVFIDGPRINPNTI